MAAVQIRPASASDLPRLMEIDHSCNSEYVWQLDIRQDAGQVVTTFNEVRLPRAIRVEYPRQVFALADDWNRNAQVLVALLETQPVGYIRLVEQEAAGLAWATDLAVSLEARRRGVGTALVLAAQEWAAGRGHRQLVLEMPSKNYPAIRLAQKLGYEFCGYNDHYYATQDIALFFGRKLR